MEETVDTLYDLIGALILMVVSVSVAALFFVNSQTPIVQVMTDKTYIEVKDMDSTEHVIYGRDLLLMLLNTDDMTPYPRAIKINDTPVINIDATYQTHKINTVTSVYSSGGSYKLADMLDWTVTKTEYVYSGPGAPYIHYVLEDI